MKYYSAIKRNEDTCHDLNKLQKHYAKGKKVDLEGYMSHDSFYTKYPEMANP